jgi:hypothetical protein
MGHARCEKLMGFNMGLASVRRNEMLVAAHALCEEAEERGLSSEMEIYRVRKTFTQAFKGTEYSFGDDLKHQYLLPASGIGHFLLRPRSAILK